MADELSELDNKIQQHMEIEKPEGEGRFIGFDKFFKGNQKILESTPNKRPKKKAHKLRKAAEKRRTQEIINMRKKEQEMQNRLSAKLQDSAVFGFGIPDEGILPKSVHGLDLGVDESGAPAQGLDRNKFLRSLDSEEMKYMKNLLQREQQFAGFNQGEDTNG